MFREDDLVLYRFKLARFVFASVEDESELRRDNGEMIMGLEDFVSENEAAAITGVSVPTLRRFTEAGYLRLESDGDGVPLFSKKELAQVFGINDCAHNPENPRETSAPHDEFFEASALEAETSNLLGTAAARIDGVDAYTGVSDTPPIVGEVSVGTDGTNAFNETHRHESALTKSLRGTIRTLEADATRLRHIIEVQEKILSIREAELADLREQREWLQARMERLEEKADRDQLLLLAETQTIRKLIALEEQRKSPLRSALEWFGFIKEGGTPREVVDALTFIGNQPIVRNSSDAPPTSGTVSVEKRPIDKQPLDKQPREPRSEKQSRSTNLRETSASQKAA